MTSDEQRWNIGDLVRETGVSRRTIHYYLHEGLLPSPEGSGRHAYYVEDHLLRLQLIALLREAGLKLDSIATCLADLDLSQMRRLVRRAEETCLDDPRELARWLHRGCGASDGDPFLMASESDPESRESDRPDPGPGGVDGEAGTWRRRELRRGVELHFRSDLDEELRQEVERLLRVARALLTDSGE